MVNFQIELPCFSVDFFAGSDLSKLLTLLLQAKVFGIDPAFCNFLET